MEREEHLHAELVSFWGSHPQGVGNCLFKLHQQQVFQHCPWKHHSLTKLKKHCVILKIQYVPLTDFLSKLILFKKSLFWKLFWEYKRITWVLTESIHRRQEISIVHLSRPEISSSLTRSQQSTGTHLWVFLLKYTCVQNLLKQICKMLYV